MITVLAVLTRFTLYKYCSYYYYYYRVVLSEDVESKHEDEELEILESKVKAAVNDLKDNKSNKK